MTNNKINATPQVDFAKVMKENPEIAKRMELQKSVQEANSTIKIFNKFEEAKKIFGFMDPITEVKELDNTAETFLLGTGLVSIKENQKNIFVPYLTGKPSVNIALDNLKDITTSKVVDTNKTIEYPNKIKVFRILFLTDEKIEVGKGEEKEIKTQYRVLTHIDSDDIVKLGNHLICKKNVPFAKDPATQLSVEDVVYIDIDNNKLTFTKEKDDNNNVYIVPIVISEEAYRSTIDNINNEWNKIKDGFIDKLIDGYTDPQKVELKKYLTSKNIISDENPYFDKAFAIFSYNNNQVIPLVDAINTNADGIMVDELNVTSNLFPKYGDENINADMYEFDKTSGLPVFDRKDLHNLKIIGLTDEMIKSLLDTGALSLNTADEIIKNHTEEERKNILNKSYDSECRCITALFENKDVPLWKLVEDNETDFSNVFELDNFDKTLDESVNHKKDIIHQMCELKNTAMRVQQKIDSGEFTNMYSSICNNYFNDFYAHTLETLDVDKDAFDPSTFPKFIKLINLDFAKFNKDNDTFLKDKMSKAFINTFEVNNTRDKFGKLPTSIFTLNEDFVSSIVDISVIPENISDSEKYDRIFQQVFTKFDFIKSVAKRPFNFITKVYPNIKEALIGHETTNDFKYADGIGIGAFAKSEECIELANKIAAAIKDIRKESYTEDNKYLYVTANDKLTKFSSSLDKRKAKSMRDVAKIGASYVAILENHNYLESITSRLSVYEEDVKNIPDERKDTYFIRDTKTNKDFNISEYDTLVEKETGTLPEGYLVLHKTNDEENRSIVLDFILKNRLNIAFVLMMNRLSGRFIDYVVEKSRKTHTLKNKEIDNFDNLFSSVTSLLVPSISALEDENIDISSEHIEISELFPNDAAIKLGVDAVKDILKDLQNKDNLINARKEYLKQCLEYVWEIVS